jgi:hypothetical protein
MNRRIHHCKAPGRKGGTFDIYAVATDALLVGWFKGVLDPKTAVKIVEFVETKEIVTKTGFNRFCDMTQLEGVDLSSDDVFQLAARRAHLIRIISASSPHFLQRIRSRSRWHVCTNRC